VKREPQTAMRNRTLLLVAWPAFISACILELVVFALVDPLELHWGGHALGWSRQAVYTAGFFLFWSAGLVTGALTWLLGSSTPGE